MVLANLAAGAGQLYGVVRAPCLLCGRMIRHIDDLLDELEEEDAEREAEAEAAEEAAMELLIRQE